MNNTQQDNDKSATTFMNLQKEYKLALKRIADAKMYDAEYPQDEHDNLIVSQYLLVLEIKKVLAEQYRVMDIVETRLAIKERCYEKSRLYGG